MVRCVLPTVIRFSRRYLSGLKPTPTCRFLPTCSEYALEALETRGVWVGGAKAAWRLLRCNPLCRGGFDPVDGQARCLHGTRPKVSDRIGAGQLELAQD